MSTISHFIKYIKKLRIYKLNNLAAEAVLSLSSLKRELMRDKFWYEVTSQTKNGSLLN